MAAPSKRPNTGRTVAAALLLALPSASAGAQAPAAEKAPREGQPAAKVERYAEALLRRYDRDGDGALSAAEWSAMQGQPAQLDRDGDGRVTVDELIDHVERYSRKRSLRLLPPARTAKADSEPGAAPAAATPVPATPVWRRFFVPRNEGSPTVQAWFDDNDVDGDGQVTMSEFSPTITEVEAARFAEIDANGDGVILPAEYQASLPPPMEEGEPPASP